MGSSAVHATLAKQNVVCIGAQWGDEGKGKIVDLLSERADWVVRFHGGNNAGHTLVVDGIQTVLHLIPSGVLHPDKVCVIGNGVVVDPEVLLQELDMLEARGLRQEPGKLIISDHAHVILPFHKRIDKAREGAAGEGKIGTTGRGIGPTYEDKAARRGMRIHDLIRPEQVARVVRQNVMYANSLLEALGAEPYQGAEMEEMIERVRRHGERIRPFVADASNRIFQAVQDGKSVLFEGAQGTMLDLDHGTYPYVTSSNCLAAHASVGAGVGPNMLGRVMAVAKTYTPRVGEGPFPTELEDEVGERLRRVGGEFGATTGRPRRCGWLDLVQLNYALQLNGATELALTKLDVLDGMETIRVCVAYELDGERLERPPHDWQDMQRVVPVYEDLPGFSGLPVDAKSIDDLPAEAQAYVRFLEERTQTPAVIISTGPGREQAILLGDSHR